MKKLTLAILFSAVFAVTCFGQETPVPKLDTDNTFTFAAPVANSKMILVDREFDGRCPVCKRQGKRSQVRAGHQATTLAMPDAYYDEQGASHSGPDNNVTTTHYSCSNGHHFSTAQGEEGKAWIVAEPEGDYFAWVKGGVGYLVPQKSPVKAPRKKRNHRKRKASASCEACFSGSSDLTYDPTTKNAHAAPLQAQVNSFSVGGFTINVPPANPVVTVQTPARSGTLALKEDIVAGPAALEAKGIITLANGVGSAALTGFTAIPICIVSDASGNSIKYSNTASLLSVAGVGPSVAYFCK